MTSPSKPGPAPTIVVPLDCSTRATAALRVARGLAEMEGATLHVVHVGERTLPPREMLEQLRLTPEELSGSVLDQVTGTAAAGIVRQAAELGSAFIVMCTHTRAEAPRDGFGCVAREVLCTAPCPVVLVRPEPTPRPWALRRLLLPHDGTPTSAAAIRPAADLADRAGAELDVLHVAAPGAARPLEPGTFAAPRYLDQPQHEWPVWAHEFLDRLCALGRPTESVRIRLFLAAGEPGPAIVEFAARHGVDLIALAWRGVLEPERAVTTRAVIGGAPCPVVVFRVAAWRCPAANRYEIDLEQVDAFLFDLDGVMTRTAVVHATAWKRLFDEYLTARAARERTAFEPFDVDRDYRRHADGKPRYAGVRSFLESRGISLPFDPPEGAPATETIRALGDRKNRYFLRLLEERGVETYPSSVALLREARSRGARTAVVTSSKNCTEVLRAARLTGLFDAQVDGVTLEQLGLPGKPAPDMFLEAARRLGVAPDRTVVLEDALAGVEAGRRGGFRLVVGVDRAGHREALLRRGADIAVADLGELRLRGRSRPTRAAEREKPG